jgi:hypothetical protein
MAVAVAGRTLGTEQLDVETGLFQTPGEILADVPVEIAGRIERRNANQILGQRHQIIAPRGNLPGQSLLPLQDFRAFHHCPPLPARGARPNAYRRCNPLKEYMPRHNSETNGAGKQIGSGDHAIADFRDARLDHAEVAGGSLGHVDDAALDKRAPVIDADDDGFAIAWIDHLDPGSEPKPRMGGCEFRRVHALARGGARGQGVPGSAAAGRLRSGSRTDCGQGGGSSHQACKEQTGGSCVKSG